MSSSDVHVSSVSPPSFPHSKAILIHEKTQTRFVLPQDKQFIYIGKANEHIPIQVELSELPNANIISRVHCVIHADEGDYYLEDAGSLNGTAINDESLKPGTRFRKKLKSGDVIILGRNRKIKLRFQITPLQ
ncbi:MAG: FHA domain-containing protein [Microcystaceae cyanobacterium]